MTPNTSTTSLLNKIGNFLAANLAPVILSYILPCSSRRIVCDGVIARNTATELLWHYWQRHFETALFNKFSRHFEASFYSATRICMKPFAGEIASPVA